MKSLSVCSHRNRVLEFRIGMKIGTGTPSWKNGRHPGDRPDCEDSRSGQGTTERRPSRRLPPIQGFGSGSGNAQRTTSTIPEMTGALGIGIKVRDDIKQVSVGSAICFSDTTGPFFQLLLGRRQTDLESVKHDWNKLRARSN